MDLITLRLADLGENCIVKNDKGEEFIALSKVRQAKRGYKDEWELQFCIQAQKSEAAGGKKKLSAFDSQTEEERKNKAPRKYIGNGIRLYEDTSGFAPQYKGSGLPNVDSGLPY